MNSTHESKDNKSPKAIAVLSGGLDSTVTTSYYKNSHMIHAITFDYGQKSAKEEINASKEIINKIGGKHTIIRLPWLNKLGNSALTNNNEIPTPDFHELDDKEIAIDFAEKVWVPGRNIVFTAIATSFAESEDAEIIIVGWDKEEAATFPDNSKKFLNNFNNLISVGSIKNIEIRAPAINLNKKEIVELGKIIDAPIELSYSCYSGEKNHCGVCESCLRRKRAFIQSGIQDNTKYQV